MSVSEKTKEYIQLCAEDLKVQQACIKYLFESFEVNCTGSDIWEYLEESDYSEKIQMMLFGFNEGENEDEDEDADEDWNAIYNVPEATKLLVEAVKKSLLMKVHT